MFTSWWIFKKPDATMAFNGVIAGLVAIIAPCAFVSIGSALWIGLVAGFLVVLSVVFFDKVLHIDDPVGAISAHGVCGAWGTLAVGLFATNGGLFYGGGAKLLGIQAVGVIAVGLWAFLTGLILFKILKSVNGLRVERKIEEEGLDVYEHGESVYN